MGNRIAYRGSSRSARDLAGAERDLVFGVDQFDIDFGHFAELQDRVGFPIERGDAIVETDLFLQYPARRLNDPAFELIDHTVRIDDQTGMSRAPNVVQGDGLVDRKLNGYGRIGGAVLVSGEGNAAAAACAAGCAWIPFRHGGNLLDHRAGARIGGDREA